MAFLPVSDRGDRARLRTSETDPRVIYRALRQPIPYSGPHCNQARKPGEPRQQFRIASQPTKAADAWQAANNRTRQELATQELESLGYSFSWEPDSDFDWQGWCDRGWPKWDAEHRCLACLALPYNFEPGMRERDARYRCEHYAEGCVVVSPQGEKLYEHALWGIVDAEGEYRRDIERDLADDVLRELAKHDMEQETSVFTCGG